MDLFIVFKPYVNVRSFERKYQVPSNAEQNVLHLHMCLKERRYYSSSKAGTVGVRISLYVG